MLINRVEYNMGRIAFAAGQPCDPGADEFFVTYAMKTAATSTRLSSQDTYSAAGTEWKTGWLTAQKEAIEYLRNSPNPSEGGENELE